MGNNVGVMRRSVLPAAAVGAVAFAVFVATLAPGLIGIEDTPKFQFIGKVLGTAHNPGYPLYVVLSHAFGWLPVGDIAWRVNLMSAVFAALTAALLQLTLVELGSSGPVSVAAGLGLATGTAFWSTATIAEVYSLNGALIAAMTYALVRWRSTGAQFWFFSAIGCFSLGLGHHTSIVTVGPAVAIFAIATAPRFALAPRTLAVILGLFALGFSQYLFVMVRTLQGAYLESTARNVSELWEVIRGAQWEGMVQPFSLGTVKSQGPIIARLLTSEVSPPVALMALVGVVALAIRDKGLLALTAGSLAGVVAFATFFPGQTPFFLVPAYFFLWLLAMVGVEATIAALPGLSVRAQAIAATTPVLAVVTWHGVTNVSVNDLSHRRFEMRYFDALTRQLPRHSALMAEDWFVDRLVLYEKFTNDVFRDHDLADRVYATPEAARDYSARGYGLFAFSKTAASLRDEGFDFEHVMWPIEYGSIRQYLADQPSGTVVALAVPAMRLGTALAADGVPLDIIGGRVPKPSWSNLAAIGAVGRSGGLQFEVKDVVASAFAGPGLPIGTSRIHAPTAILAEAVYDRASIRVGAREVIRSHWPVVALWDPHGTMIAAFAFTPDGRAPVQDSPVSVHRLRAVREWIQVASRPVNISSASAGGHVLVRPVPNASALVVYAGRQDVLAPHVFDPTIGAPDATVDEFRGGSEALGRALGRDGWPEQPALQGMAHVYRIELGPFNGPRQLAFGGIPDVVLARQSGPGDPAALYGLDLTGQLEPIDDSVDRLRVARDHHQLFLAAGWSAISGDGAGGFSKTSGARAEILLPCGAGACSTVDMQLMPEGDGGTVGLEVNGAPLETQPMVGGWNRYRWAVPAGALHAGVNSFVLRVATPVVLSDVLVAKAGTSS